MQAFNPGIKLIAILRDPVERAWSYYRHEMRLGAMATVFDPAEDWQPVELTAKLDAGARSVQTQICLDLELLRRYMKVLVAAQVIWCCHVVVSVPVLTSAHSARWLHENLRGCVVPESVARRFESARDPEAFGIGYRYSRARHRVHGNPAHEAIRKSALGYNLYFRRSASAPIGGISGGGHVLTADLWSIALTLLGILIAFSGLYWRIRSERIRAEEKAEERRDTQIASIAESMKKEMDQLRDQVQASDQRLSELDSGSQRAIGRIEGMLEAMREPK